MKRGGLKLLLIPSSPASLTYVERSSGAEVGVIDQASSDGECVKYDPRRTRLASWHEEGQHLVSRSNDGKAEYLVEMESLRTSSR